MDVVDWIDLPNDNYLAILGYETQNTIALDTLIRKYNEIPKTQIVTLSERIRKLGEIVDLIRDWIDNYLELIDKKKHLMWILEIASKKRNYLIQLIQIYENQLYVDTIQNDYHTDISALKDSSKKPVFLTNHRFFSLKMREYWGDFWLETLDPCHRRLTPFFDQWIAIKKINFETPHFFLWLEIQHIPSYVPRVIYLRGDSLENKKLIIKNGLFFKKSDAGWILANFNISSKRYLFTIDLMEEIYSAEEGFGISHSSFTCGKPVIGAGLLRINQGQLTFLALESGHYMPSIETGYQILQTFEEKGALLPNNLEIVFFYDRNKYMVELTANPLPSLKKFKEILESAYAPTRKGYYASNTM